MSNYEEEDVGFHFDPRDEELIKSYLIPKLRGEACGDFIGMMDVYAKEPWLLNHTNNPFLMEDVWYYFTPKKQVSTKKIGCGKNSKRRISVDNDGLDRGSWKQNYKENIIEEETGNIIGTKENLTYTTRNKKKLKRGDGAYSALVPVPVSEYSWIMNEYMLPDDGKFQTLVLCEIHKTKNFKNKDKNPHESSEYSSELQPINIHSESVVAASLEHQQPLLWGANESETERTREQIGEGNMLPQVEALSMTERGPEEKDEQVEWITDYMDKFETLNGSAGSKDQNLLAQFLSICFT